MGLGHRIRSLRGLLEKNRTDFAEIVGISVARLGEVERGEGNINSRYIISIIKSFSVNPYWLLLGEGSIFLAKKAIEDISNNQAQIFLEELFLEKINKENIFYFQYLLSILEKNKTNISDKTFKSRFKKALDLI